MLCYQLRSLTSVNHRCLSTASITVASLSLLQNPSLIKMRLASVPQISASGIKSSSLSIRRCSSKSSSLPITWTSSRYCKVIWRCIHSPVANTCRSDVGCKTVANMIKGKTPEEIRKLFNIVNDFTPEEEVRCCRRTFI